MVGLGLAARDWFYGPNDQLCPLPMDEDRKVAQVEDSLALPQEGLAIGSEVLS
jgi:hypothetical protein